MSEEHTFEIETLDPDLLGRPIASGRTAEVFDSGSGWVVKLFAFGIGKEAAFHELDALKTAALHGISVPEPGDLVLMKMRWGFAMKKVEGVNGMQRILSGENPDEAGRLYARLQHDLASHSGKFLPLLTESAARKVKALAFFSEEERGRLIKMASQAPQGDRLLHGDFHPGNVMWPMEGPPVFTDWVDAAKGHPAADLARSLVLFGWQTEAGSQPDRMTFTQAFREEWEALNPGVLDLAEAWLPLARAIRTGESAEASPEELAGLVRQAIE